MCLHCCLLLRMPVCNSTHNCYSREVLVVLSAENHTLIYLLASLAIASWIYLTLKRKPDGQKVCREIYHSTIQVQCVLKQKSSFSSNSAFFILHLVPRVGDAIAPKRARLAGPRVIIPNIPLNDTLQLSKLISSFFQCKPRSYLSHSSFPKPYVVLKWVGLIFPEKTTTLCLLEQ